MRRVFLIRHGHPDFPLGAHMCLGRTDTPLGPLGRMQACLLGAVFSEKALAVYSSPLTRCRETASALEKVPRIIPALAEQDMGVWDGLDFDTIRERWPELYARRKTEPLLVPPGAETLTDVRRRVLPAFENCLDEISDDAAFVVHASVIQVILAEVSGIRLEESRPLRPPYASFALLFLNGSRQIAQTAQFPSPALTPELARSLLSAADPGERIAAHCRAVADEALRIAYALPFPLDLETLESAALLHDIARKEKDHALLGAAWLRQLGFDSAARLVEQHHDLQGNEIDEAAVLFLADKCVQENRRVPLEERFRTSAERCTTPEAIASHAGRRDAALRVKDQINALCGRVLVE